jgi:hypothetical protein
VCPVCGCGRAWVLGRRHLWECAACGVQTSVTAGTVMHRTRTPLRVWFWAAYLVATHHPGISAKQLQRQLGLSRYETAWLMLQKLRRAMVAPEREPLKGEVEVDECYLGGHDPWTDGRELGKKRLVGLAIELRGRASRRLRLQTLGAASGKWLGEFVQATVAPGAVVHTDGFSGYNGLGGLGYDHRPRSQRAAPAGEWLLPRAHRAVSNLKAATRHPPRRRRPTPAGLPRRVRLPPQPPPHPDGRVPDAARPQQPAQAHHLRPDHPARQSHSLSQPDTHVRGSAARERFRVAPVRLILPGDGSPGARRRGQCRAHR